MLLSRLYRTFIAMAAYKRARDAHFLERKPQVPEAGLLVPAFDQLAGVPIPLA
jgi:hypothetical protein